MIRAAALTIRVGGMIERIREIIEQAVPGATAHVASPDGEHFEALVISPEFEELSLVKQHQLVMRALSGEFESRMHALQLKTFTPAEWESEQARYNV